jgi:hypothetical protein
VVTDPLVDRDQQGLSAMFRRRHASNVADVNRFSQVSVAPREMRELAHATQNPAVRRA